MSDETRKTATEQTRKTATELRTRSALQRSAFISGVEWVAKHLEAAATIVAVDKHSEISGHNVITKTGDPCFATRLRNLATSLRFEASRQALERYPNWNKE